MYKALFQAVIACFLWGAVFAVPLYLEEYSSIDICSGRFLFYGVFSLFILLFYIIFGKERGFLKYWKKASLCALIMNFIHFISLTLGMRFVSPALITVILGISPIVITIASCFMNRSMHSFSNFLWPSISIFIGLCFMNVETLNFSDETSGWEYIQGIFYGFVALVTWCWYIIYNSNFLNMHKDVNGNQWTALIGLMTLCFILIVIASRYYFMGSEHFYQFSWEHEKGRYFLLAMFILGIFCSWVAFALWNNASYNIPPVLAGQISILETIFGLAFVFSIQQQLPTPMESIGIILILAGISFGLYFYTSQEKLRHEAIMKSCLP